MPRSLSRSPSRWRNTSPRDLAMSRIPIVSPSRLSGRGRRGRTVGLRSEVGSSNTVIYTSLYPHPSFPRKRNPGPQVQSGCAGPRFRGGDDASIPHLLGDWQTTAGATRRPAADNTREHPGIPTGTHDQQAARTEFVDGFAGERRRPAFGDALGACDELFAGNLAQAIELLQESPLRPAGFSERPMVLRADHEHRIASRRQFDAVNCLQRLSEAARQALGVA